MKKNDLINNIIIKLLNELSSKDFNPKSTRINDNYFFNTLSH